MKRCLIALILFRLTSAFASSEAVSPSFVFDASYLPSPTNFVWEVAREASGLSDQFTAKTVDIAVDTDGDGLPDAWELAHGLNPNVPDADADPDHDGLTNRMEYNAGTNPASPDNYAASIATSLAFLADLHIENLDTNSLVTPTEVWFLSARFLTDTIGISPDTDGDGMRDDWEIAHGLNPLVPDGHLDSDNDGRTNLEEYNASTDPMVPDDWSRSLLASSAFLTDTHIPYIPGRLPLVEETYVIFFEGTIFVCETGGLYYDWDGDGIPNWWEARFARSKTGLSASDDPDGDGRPNWAEFVSYTDPTNGSSVFAISQIRPVGIQSSTSIDALNMPAAGQEPQSESAGSSLLLTWQSAANRRYRVYASTDLLNWSAQPILTVDGTGEPLTVEVPQSQNKQFYRVTVDLIP